MFKHKSTSEEQLAAQAEELREAAERAPPGSPLRDELLKRARQAETASHAEDWVTSPGLQSPK